MATAVYRLTEPAGLGCPQGNDTAGVDIYTGPLPCDILWYASNNNKVYCRTHPLYSVTRETKLVYSNWLVATRTSCKDCFYEFNVRTRCTARRYCARPSPWPCRH